TDDIDAVERRLGSNLLATQREIEAFIRDGELEVLRDLVLVHHLARPHPNGAASLELATRNHFAHLLELLGGRRNQRLSLMCTQLRELRIAAGHEPFAGEVGVRELEQVAMIKQSQLQLPINDKGSNLPALQCRDPTEVLRAQFGN